jgi:signal transduction histidine kinase
LDNGAVAGRAKDRLGAHGDRWRKFRNLGVASREALMAGKPIDVSVAGNDEDVQLVVLDRGIGISKDKIPVVFNRFERAVPGRKYGGLGLGLYIAQRVVEAHGGRIQVESEPGRGATFVVHLPRRPLQPAT